MRFGQSIADATTLPFPCRKMSADRPRPSRRENGAAAPLRHAEDWAFLSHRLPMARAARDTGFEVHVATRVNDGAAAIEAERFILHPIPFARGSLSPFAALRTVAALRHIRRTIRPDVTHHVALQSCVLGAMAMLGAQDLASMHSSGWGIRSPRAAPRRARYAGLSAPRSASWSIVTAASHWCRTATTVGVDFARHCQRSHRAHCRIGRRCRAFHPLAEPQGPPTFGFVGRLLDDKGVRTLIAAHRVLRARGSDARLLIAGTPDPANPASVTEAEATSWNKETGITWLGHVGDIAGLWTRAHVAVLPSRREGLPLSLMEAAACGRAMIASDVPGCREIVITSKPDC